MHPRSIDDQPGEVPGEGKAEVPRAVRYLMDGYPGHVQGWRDDDPPAVVLSSEAWNTAVNDAAECGDVLTIGIGTPSAGLVALAARIKVGDDGDEVFVACQFVTNGTQIVVNW